MALKDNVKRLREQMNLSQQQLAEAVGVNAAMISYIESGTKVPSLAVTISLSKTLGCSIDELVGQQ
ncbi:helix-turn-helix domain-containing protein [Caproiciproducens sp.]